MGTMQGELLLFFKKQRHTSEDYIRLTDLKF